MSIVTVVILFALLLIAVWRELEVQKLRRQNETLRKELAEAREVLASYKRSARVR